MEATLKCEFQNFISYLYSSNPCVWHLLKISYVREVPAEKIHKAESTVCVLVCMCVFVSILVTSLWVSEYAW